MKGREWTSPTEIGMSFGKEYNKASGWASPKCLQFVADGIMERNDHGHYRLSESSKSIESEETIIEIEKDDYDINLDIPYIIRDNSGHK